MNPLTALDVARGGVKVVIDSEGTPWRKTGAQWQYLTDTGYEIGFSEDDPQDELPERLGPYYIPDGVTVQLFLNL